MQPLINGIYMVYITQTNMSRKHIFKFNYPRGGSTVHGRYKKMLVGHEGGIQWLWVLVLIGPMSILSKNTKNSFPPEFYRYI